MALIECNFYSDVLNLSTKMTVILPQNTRNQIGMENKAKQDKHPTLFLLHGFSDDDSIWLRRTSIERYVAELGLAVVMPQVHHSFYTDMKYGNKFWTFLSKELPTIARSFFPLSEKREDNFVAGLSMGGYGAFKWALSKPENFAAAASLSGVMDIAQRKRESGSDLPLHLVFGDEDLEGTKHDIYHLLDKLDESEGPKPMLYQCCGTKDFLYQDNVEFSNYCQNKSFDYKVEFDPDYQHEWGYWDLKIQEVLKWLPLNK